MSPQPRDHASNAAVVLGRVAFHFEKSPSIKKVAYHEGPTSRAARAPPRCSVPCHSGTPVTSLASLGSTPLSNRKAPQSAVATGTAGEPVWPCAFVQGHLGKIFKSIATLQSPPSSSEDGCLCERWQSEQSLRSAQPSKALFSGTVADSSADQTIALQDDGCCDVAGKCPLYL